MCLYRLWWNLKKITHYISLFMSFNTTIKYICIFLRCKRLIYTFSLIAFPENKSLEADDSKVVSTSNHWDKTKSNEVSVTFTLSSAAAKVWSQTITAFSPFLTVMHSQEKLHLKSCFFSSSSQKLNHVMMAMAQLLNIRIPGSYELTFPPQTPDMSGVDSPGKRPCQSGMHLETVVMKWLYIRLFLLFH